MNEAPKWSGLPKNRFDTIVMRDGTVVSVDQEWMCRIQDGGLVIFPAPANDER